MRRTIRAAVDAGQAVAGAACNVRRELTRAHSLVPRVYIYVIYTYTCT